MKIPFIEIPARKNYDFDSCATLTVMISEMMPWTIRFKKSL